MPEDWSDKPVVVDGVAFDVGRAISPQRRRDVAETLRRTGKGDRSAMDIERDYLEWRRAVHTGYCNHVSDGPQPLGCRRCGKMWKPFGG